MVVFLWNMSNMLKSILFLFALILSVCVSAQPRPVIPLIRKVFHDNIDKSQKVIDLLDKKEDKSFNAGTDQEVDLQVSYTLFNKVDDMQDNIELDSSLNPNEKVRFLRGLNEVLSSFERGSNQKN